VTGPNNTIMTADYYYITYPFTYHFKYSPSETLFVSIPFSNYVASTTVSTFPGILLGDVRLMILEKLILNLLFVITKTHNLFYRVQTLVFQVLTCRVKSTLQQQSRV
jgi:hypothetical protein